MSSIRAVAELMTHPGVSGSYARRRGISHPRRMATAIDLKGARVLVVDDDPFIREVVTVMLRLAGARVAVAESAPEGFDMLRRLQPQVLVSDIRMPVEDGYSLMRRVRALPEKEGGSIPAIAITAFGQEEDRSRALTAGFQVHMTKPLDPEQLQRAVGSLLGG